jgi:uncharacterized membrane protein
MEKIQSDGNYHNPSRVDLRVAHFILDMDMDLKLIIGLAIVALISIYVPVIEGTPVRIVLALAMIVLAPGYSLVAALFPAREDIDVLERMALSLGMSVIIAPLIGLGLNFTDWGIRLEPIAVCLAAFSIATVLIANKRRLDMPEESRFSPHLMKTVKAMFSEAFPKNARLTEKALTAVLLLSIILSVSVIAYVIVFPQYGEKFTEFYILGPNGKAENYTTSYHLGDSGTFIIGVANHEQRNVSYNVIVQLENNAMTKTLYTDNMTLADNQTLERTTHLTPDMIGTNMKLQFLLYKDGNTSSPYRECHVWVNVTSPITP